MLTPFQSSQFKKDIKLVKKRNLNIKKLQDIVEILLNEKPLAQKCKDHELVGNWRGYRECHIQPDWLLIYKIDGNVLKLARTGSHSDLF